MVSLLVAYLTSSLVATALYARVAHRVDVGASLQAEADWWDAFSHVSRRGARRATHAEVLRELRSAGPRQWPVQLAADAR